MSTNKNEQNDDVTPSTGRVRRTTQKFTIEYSATEDAAEFTPPQGAGTKLRDMEAVAAKIADLGKKDVETIKALYSVMYGRRFQQKNMKVIKEHILDFSGIPDVDDKVREQLMAKIGRWMRNFLQFVMDVLMIDRSKKSFDEENKPFDKDALMERLVEWLCNPQESEKARKASKSTKIDKPAKATKRKSSSDSKPVSKKQKKSTPKKTKTKSKEDEDVVDEEATESEVDPEENEDDDSDFDESKKPSKSSTTSRRKTIKKQQKKKDDEDEEEEDDAPEEDQENEAPEEDNNKKTKDELPAEIQEKIRSILSKGNAEELTLKKIMKQMTDELGQVVILYKKAIKQFITQQ